MREMKDSGIAWIGAIPNHWRVSKIKQIVRWKSVKGQPDLPVLSLYRDYGVIPKDSRDDNHNVTSLDTSGYKVVEHGDLVINKMKAWQGSLAVSEYNGIVSPAYHICKITSENICKKYLHYLLRDASYLPEYMRLSTGLRVGQWDLSFDDFKNIPFLVPSLAEQERIAAFLDAECAEIDAVLEKTRASIEEYKKLKQAVITQAVTKGIRGDRPMKDSGIEWIGEIPAEWDYTKAKNCVNIQNGSDPKAEGSIPVYGSGASSFKTCGEYKEGPSVLIGRKGATLHIPHYISTKFWNVDTAFNVYAKPNFDLKFYFYCACSFDYRFYISQTTLPSMTQTAYENMFLPLPSNDEQRAIASYLDNRCEEIDALIWKKQECLVEIENYKKSLIYEYVTGKREV